MICNFYATVWSFCNERTVRKRICILVLLRGFLFCFSACSSALVLDTAATWLKGIQSQTYDLVRLLQVKLASCDLLQAFASRGGTPEEGRRIVSVCVLLSNDSDPAVRVRSAGCVASAAKVWAGVADCALKAVLVCVKRLRDS